MVLMKLVFILQLLEVHCNEIQNSLVGGNVFSVANGHEYCTALLKASCCFSQQLPSSERSSPSNSLSSLTHPHALTASPHHPSFSSTPISPPTLTNNRRALKTNAEVTPDSSTRNEDGNQANRSTRPPRSQGIAIVGASYPRQRSSLKRGSYPSSGAGSFNPFGTSEGKFGSFMKNAAIFNSSYGSSATSWSIWNASSVETGSHAPPGSSLHSWFWVNGRDGSDQSGKVNNTVGVPTIHIHALMHH